MKTPLDFADIVRRFSGDYITQFGDVLLPSQKKAIFDMATCHTMPKRKSIGRRIALVEIKTKGRSRMEYVILDHTSEDSITDDTQETSSP